MRKKRTRKQKGGSPTTPPAFTQFEPEEAFSTRRYLSRLVVLQLRMDIIISIIVWGVLARQPQV